MDYKKALQMQQAANEWFRMKSRAIDSILKQLLVEESNNEEFTDEKNLATMIPFHCQRYSSDNKPPSQYFIFVYNCNNKDFYVLQHDENYELRGHDLSKKFLVDDIMAIQTINGLI